MKKRLTYALAVGALVGIAATTMAQDDGLAGLVTEEVEPGVVRIVSDSAGHDLDETHPTYRYDMDNIFVSSDGTIWLSSSYSREDNDANPPGSLTWALGQTTANAPFSNWLWGMVQHAADGPICGTQGDGVTCFDPATGSETTYLEGTGINQVAFAPDGTLWAVGGYAGDNGGLYRITLE